VAITQNQLESDHSLTGGGDNSLKAPTFDISLGNDSTTLRAAFDEAVEKGVFLYSLSIPWVGGIFSLAGVNVTSGETAHLIVTA